MLDKNSDLQEEKKRTRYGDYTIQVTKKDNFFPL